MISVLLQPPKRLLQWIILIMGLLSSVSNILLHHSTMIVRDANAVAPINLRPTESNASETKVATTTIIISSNLVPSHPSLSIIDATMDSLKYLQGLPEETPIIVTVDGSFELQRWSEYIRNLNHSYPNVQVLVSPKAVGLNQNIRRAMEKVQSEFVYVLQHDIAFAREINHTGLVETFQDHTETVRLVRFNLRGNLERRKDRGFCKEKEIHFYAHGINLTKTHKWSDK
jgi:hypothetical protein